MQNSNKLSDWIPLISKLVWPFFIVVAILIFHQQASEIYQVVMTSIKSGRSVEIGGFLKLGEAATNTRISEISRQEIPIKGIGGSSGVVRKSSLGDLQKLQRELEQNPQKTINTMVLPDNITFSVDLMKQYVSTLGLSYVVFQKRGRFDGWISSSTFIAQLPREDSAIKYQTLQDTIIGINIQTVSPDLSARKVLEKMQELHIDSIPVVDENQKWLFFANRGEILARLMTTMILQQEK